MEGSPPVTVGSCEYLNKQSRTADKGWSSSLGAGVGLTPPQLKKILLRNVSKRLGPGLCPSSSLFNGRPGLRLPIGR
jgi:hypothetical protein